MRRVLVLALFVCACSGDPTGSSFPSIAGTYGATFAVSFSNSIETESSSVPGTVTLHSPSSGGDFSGSYVMAGAGSGTIAGTIRTDGGISITQFGDPNADPLESLQILQNEFYWCNFNQAAGSPMSGAYFGAIRPPIPFESGHPFRTNPATCFGGIRPGGVMSR